MTRQQVIESFVNDHVEKVSTSLYVWRKRYYEVLPYQDIINSKTTRPDHFVRWEYAGVFYGIREISKDLIKKHYPNLTIDR